MSIQKAAATIDEVSSQQNLTVMIFYRGHWCPFCSAHAKELNGEFRKKIEAKGGKLYAVTSEGDDGIKISNDKWGLDYDILSDRSLELAKRYGVFITDGKDAHGGVEKYPDGMSQPAVIAIDKTGKMIFRWAIIPSEMNMGGAVDRPLTKDLLDAIDKAISSKEMVELKVTKNGKVDVDFVAKNANAYGEEHQMILNYMAMMKQNA